MDQTHDHGLLIKKVGKFLVSVCVCFFCFSQASLLSFLQSINFYLSTFPYKLLTHTMDKNSIFLIFNLLLVVLAKYSGLIRSLSWSSTCYRISDEASFNINTEGGFRVESSMLRQEDQEAIASSSTDNVSNAGDQKEGEFFINQVEQDADNAVEEYKEEEHDEPKSRFIISEEEEEETGIFTEEYEEAGNGMLTSSTSTEELNKKFDDFIRRMKEELRIEAQRQPIMV